MYCIGWRHGYTVLRSEHVLLKLFLFRDHGVLGGMFDYLHGVVSSSRQVCSL